MRKFAAFGVAGLAAAAASAGSALAQSDYGRTYWAVNVGASFPPDQDLEGDFSDAAVPGPIAFGGEIEFDPGFFGSLAWGYNFAPIDRSGFGLEVEGFYQALNPESFSFGGLDLDPNVDDEEEFFGGDASIFGGFVNAFYHLRGASPWTAKLGGGVGYGRVAYDVDNAFDEGDGAFVYQGIVGAGYRLSERWELQATGRYFGASDTEFDDDNFDGDAQFDTFVATVGFTFYN